LDGGITRHLCRYLNLKFYLDHWKKIRHHTLEKLILIKYFKMMTFLCLMKDKRLENACKKFYNILIIFQFRVELKMHNCKMVIEMIVIFEIITRMGSLVISLNLIICPFYGVTLNPLVGWKFHFMPKLNKKPWAINLIICSTSKNSIK